MEKELYMGLKYNAFISYRHSEVDSKIASEVQTRLERFRIPKAIIKKTGVKRFERIFRDKEELPITSDLNDDIDEALANSDNLIVICSTRTNDSIWVRKEIETFLKYHEKKDVFTVLVDGEPEQVIPDILLHDTVTTVLPDGRIETREEVIEPLSCDYRMDIKKARKVELPRLAASMLHVSYDELVQRRKQYIRRRNSIIGCCAAVAIAAIIGYLTWSLLQIKMNYDMAQENFALAQSNYEQAQSNYMEALRNQSAYLASESRELLTADDRLGAVQLALAALPSETKDRPVTCEAEYALSTALGMYRTPGLSDSDVVWNYGSGYLIEKFRIDQNNQRIASLDSLGNLNVWSLKDHTLLQTVESGSSELLNFLVDSEGRIALAYEDTLRVMDADLQTQLWSMELEEKYSGSSVYDTFRLSHDGSEIIYFSHDMVAIYDFLTGEMKGQYYIADHVDVSSDYSWGIGIQQVIYSPDDSKLALVYTYDKDSEGIILFDRQTNEWKSLGSVYKYIPDFSFTPNSEKLIFSYDEPDDTMGSYSLSGIEVLRENIRHIDCYDVATCEQLWGNTVSHTLIGYNSEVKFVNYGYEDARSAAVAVSFSNRCVVIDLQTGEKLTERELSSEFINSYVNESETKMYFILRNGHFMIMRLDNPDQAMSGYEFFKDDIDDTAAFIGPDGSQHYMIKTSGTYQLTEYSALFYDRSYNPIVETGDENIYRYIVSGKRLFALDSNMNLYCVDMTSGKVTWTEKVYGDNFAAVTFIGSDASGNVYMINSTRIDDDYGDKLYVIDPGTGEITRVEDFPDTTMLKYDYVDGCLYASYSGGFSEIPYILKYDTSDGSYEKIELDVDSEGYFPVCDLYVSPDGKHAIMMEDYNSSGTTYLVNLENGKLITLDITGKTFAAWSPDSEWVAISTGEAIHIYQADGPRKAVLSDFETSVADMFVCEKGLIALLNNGFANLYDEEGNLLTSLDAFCGFVSSVNLDYEDTTFRIDEDILVIKFGEYSSVIYLDEFKVKVIIAGLLSYEQDSQRYFVRTYGNVGGAGAVGYFKVRSIDELIAEGVQFVGDAAMTSDMKKRYGIED